MARPEANPSSSNADTAATDQHGTSGPGAPPATFGWAVREGMRVGMKVSAPIGGGLLVLGAIAAAMRGDWSAYAGLALGVLIGLVVLPLLVAAVYGAVYVLLARHERG